MQYDCGSYESNKCKLEFKEFEADLDSGDWKVVVVFDRINNDRDEFIFSDVFSTKQADVRIEDPSAGDREGKLFF